MGRPEASQTVFLPDDPASLGYIAGLVDGEGCIDRRNNQPGFNRLRVGMTDEPTIRWLASFGGRFEGPRKLKSGKSFWTWEVYRARDFRHVIEKILPFMITKQQVARESLA